MVESNGPPANVSLLEGLASEDGFFEIELPHEEPVAEAAAANNGFVNFYLTYGGVDDSGVFFAGGRGFYANVGNPAEGAPLAATSLPSELATGQYTECDMTMPGVGDSACFVDFMTCYAETQQTIVDLGQFRSQTFELNFGYGLITKPRYGATHKADTQVGIAISDPNTGAGGWLKEGEHHVGTPTLSLEGYGRNPIQTSDTRALNEYWQTWIRMFEHTGYYRTPYGAGCGSWTCPTEYKCVKQRTQRPGDWDIGGKPVPLGDLYEYGAGYTSSNDAYDSFPANQQDGIRVLPDADDIWVSGLVKNREFSAGICALVCVTTASGYSEHVRLGWEGTSHCNGWWLYDHAGGQSFSGGVVFVDSGNAGPGVSNGKPAGCS